MVAKPVGTQPKAKPKTKATPADVAAPPAKTDQDIIQDLSQDLMKSQQRVATQAGEIAKLKQLVAHLRAQIRGQGAPVTAFQLAATFTPPFAEMAKRLGAVEAKIDALSGGTNAEQAPTSFELTLCLDEDDEGGQTASFPTLAAAQAAFGELKSQFDTAMIQVRGETILSWDGEGEEMTQTSTPDITTHVTINKPQNVKQCWKDNVHSIESNDFRVSTMYPAGTTTSQADGDDFCLESPDGTSVQYTTTHTINASDVQGISKCTQPEDGALGAVSVTDIASVVAPAV